MPVYTYHCESCGVQFDTHQSYNDQPLTRCPECNKKSLRKVYLPVGIVFKGKGFYSTDHKSSSGGKYGSSKESSSSSDGESSAEKKSSDSETKSASSEKSGSSEKSDSKKSED